jgi:DNA (cytosine-5)-methyltransferase 1
MEEGMNRSTDRDSTQRPIGVDLFAGAGGLSLGFEQAGFDVVAAVELDPVHAAVHKFNFPDCAVLPRSAAEVSGASIREAAGIGERPVDVVFGGAPCQGFSLIGHRSLDDPRNSLVSEFVRIVSELEASYFVFENVKGLTIGRQKQFLEEVIRTFSAAGYRILTPWRVLNATNYGVPQDRERLFLIGARGSRPLPKYPEQLTQAAGHRQPTLGVPTGPSCRDALHDLPDAEQFDELWSGDSVRVGSWKPIGKYAREMHCARPSDWHYGYRRAGWKRNVLTSSGRTEHTPISRRRFSGTPSGTVEPISRFYKLPGAGVSNTLRAGTDSARGAFTSPRPIHYELPRCITVREMARLHGFPDWFRFHVTKWHGARQIGNAVPPPLARAVATEVARAMEYSPVRPARSVSLGSVELLSMGMRDAAEFWAVKVPILRRDRRSGVKKRKQAEIEAQLRTPTRKSA